MKLLFPLCALVLLSACGEEPAPEPTPSVAAEPVETLPAPDEELFAEVFATTCPEAEKVSTSVCARAMGAEEALCEFGIGEDTALRHEAKIKVEDNGWVLDMPAEICAEHDSHHVDAEPVD